MLSLKLPSPTCVGTFLAEELRGVLWIFFGEEPGLCLNTALLFCFFWPHHVACGILVPRPGTEPMPPAEVRRLNHLGHWRVSVSLHCCFLTLSLLFLHSLTLLISNLTLSFGTQERSRRLNEVCFLKTRNRAQRKDLYSGGPHWVLLGFHNDFIFAFKNSNCYLGRI